MILALPRGSRMREESVDESMEVSLDDHEQLKDEER